jgi:hypothetical protein
VTDAETKEVRDRRAAEQLERDRAWYDQQRAEARQIAGRAGKLASTIIDGLDGEPYDSLTKHGLEARISPFVEIPRVETEDVRIIFGRVFVAYSVEHGLERPRRRWFSRQKPQSQDAPEPAIARVGIHYYSRPDADAYRGATVQWDGSLHGSVGDATLTLGVLQALVDLRHPESSEEAPETALSL